MILWSPTAIDLEKLYQSWAKSVAYPARLRYSETMRVLGIETSCDETAAAIVDDDRRVLSNVVLSQLDDHRPFGGVVPEIAARAHLTHLDGIIEKALTDADIGFEELDAVAATTGPGLIGGVMVGAITAKAIALARGLPFVAVNHLEGHALTARLTNAVEFPYLLLLVSGGHCQLLAVEGVGRYTRYGTTVDDAVGEAFDKTAKLLGLGFPGGPAVERAATQASNPKAFDLPRPMAGKPHCDFSFSGLKSAVRRHCDALQPRSDGTYAPEDVQNLAAGFQQAAADVLADRTRRAADRFIKDYGSGVLVVAGGVAANQTLRVALENAANDAGMGFAAPPPGLCTDNGAMIAWAGLERFRLGRQDPLDFKARPRWPLDDPSLAVDDTIEGASI